MFEPRCGRVGEAPGGQATEPASGYHIFCDVCERERMGLRTCGALAFESDFESEPETVVEFLGCLGRGLRVRHREGEYVAVTLDDAHDDFGHYTIHYDRYMPGRRVKAMHFKGLYESKKGDLREFTTNVRFERDENGEAVLVRERERRPGWRLHPMAARVYHEVFHALQGCFRVLRPATRAARVVGAAGSKQRRAGRQTLGTLRMFAADAGCHGSQWSEEEGCYMCPITHDCVPEGDRFVSDAGFCYDRTAMRRYVSTARAAGRAVLDPLRNTPLSQSELSSLGFGSDSPQLRRTTRGDLDDMRATLVDGGPDPRNTIRPGQRLDSEVLLGGGATLVDGVGGSLMTNLRLLPGARRRPVNRSLLSELDAAEEGRL